MTLLSYAKMSSHNAISGSLAQCIITIGEKQYNFMQLIDFEAKVEKTKKDIPILGQTGKGHKTTSWSGTFKGKAHYNQSVLSELLAKYKKDFSDTYFTIQVINEDGDLNQTVILNRCNTNGGVLTKFDVNADFLEEEIEGTFEDFEINTGFILPNMELSEQGTAK